MGMFILIVIYHMYDACSTVSVWVLYFAKRDRTCCHLIDILFILKWKYHWFLSLQWLSWTLEHWRAPLLLSHGWHISSGQFMEILHQFSKPPIMQNQLIQFTMETNYAEYLTEVWTKSNYLKFQLVLCMWISPYL